MLGLFTAADAAPSSPTGGGATVPRRLLPTALARERSVDDLARPVGPLSAAAAANVAQPLLVSPSLGPAVVQTSASGASAAPLASAGPALMLTSLDSAPVSAPAPVAQVLSDAGEAPEPEVSQAQSEARSSATGDELELFPLVPPEEAQPKSGGGSGALWVTLGLVSVAAIGGVAIALAGSGK